MNCKYCGLKIKYKRSKKGYLYTVNQKDGSYHDCSKKEELKGENTKRI